MTFVRKAWQKISTLALATYRALPISPARRQRLKHFLFGVFGFAFGRMDAYQRWQAYRKIQTGWPSTDPAAPPTPAGAATIGTVPSQLVADGVWEWSDYAAVKERISNIKAGQLSEVSPSPLEMVDIDNEPFESVAARVRLPAPPAEPDVSIILPVFNNLKLTLECLLSISANSDSRASFEIILADDASADDTARIAATIANLRVMRNERNLGFLRNCNRALEHVKGRYVVYLNNDVQVTHGWLANLLQTFTIEPNAGAAGPGFVYPSGHLQEAGVAFRHDGTADMVGLNDDPEKPQYRYLRRVDYISGACLMLPARLAREMGGFSEDFLPCYCEDSDLCLRIQAAGYHVYYNPASTIIHHLSKTTAAFDSDFKLRSIAANLVRLQQKWQEHFDLVSTVKVMAFYLPRIPSSAGDGRGWDGATHAPSSLASDDHPRIAADSGAQDLLTEVIRRQADLAQRYGIHGFCFYYRWSDGMSLDPSIAALLATGAPDMPFCLCWANDDWSRPLHDGDHKVARTQSLSREEDEAVAHDLIRFLRDPRYIRIDGRPLVLVYRVTLFANFSTTVAHWRQACRQQGIGEIYVAMVESFDLVHATRHPQEFGCDAAVELPPQGVTQDTLPFGRRGSAASGGAVADYRDLAVRYATREFPDYTRFKGVIPGWDNAAPGDNASVRFEQATPGAFQAWLEESLEQTRQHHYGDERLVFINAWNGSEEGACLEPDRRFGHTYLEAVKNASEAAALLRRNKYWHGN